MDILLEQLVYGSFPFWDRGYDVLAKSPGCRPEWVADVLAACRQFGEAPSGVTPSPCLFATRLASGPWAVVGVEPLGQDDRGRPGALAFHALLIPDRDYRRAGSNPFAFAGVLRREWSAGASLELRWTDGRGLALPPARPADPRARRIVEALSRGRRVVIESAGPIEALAREVWLGPARIEAAAGLGGDLGLRQRQPVRPPRRPPAGGPGVRSLLCGSGRDRGRVASDRSRIRAMGRPPPTGPAGVAVAVLAGLVAAGLAWRGMGGPKDPSGPDREAPGSVDPEAPVDPEERARIVEGLEAMADRFEAFEIGRWGDPSELMARISDRLRYRGATLSEADRARLAAEPDPDRDRALAWHDRIKAFADDRPLPGDFDRLPLRRQLAEFARSFHLDPPTRPDAIPGFRGRGPLARRPDPAHPAGLATTRPSATTPGSSGRLPRSRGEVRRTTENISGGSP